MDNLEKLLTEEKMKLEEIEIPDNMEERLRLSLNKMPIKKKKRIQLKTASIIIMIMLLSYNIDTLAFYAKKLVGYEYLMDGTLNKLNEMGKGQTVNKSYTFSDGLELVVDGVMLDDNNLVVFYTINDPEKDAQNKDVNVYITGSFSGTFSGGGSGIASSDGSRMSWIMSTDRAPKIFERTITLDLGYRSVDGTYESGEISFKLDRNQAVGNSIKINIYKKMDIGNRSLKVETMVASPTTTVVRGNIQNLLELGIDYINDTRIRPENIEMTLTADGKEISVKAGGMSTDRNGSNFYITFDALPVETKKVELKLVSFSGDYDVNRVFEISKFDETQFIILGETVVIEEVYEDDGSTYITFKTDENTQLSRVYLIIDGEKHELQETIHGELEKILEGDASRVLYRRTMRYNGTGDKLELDIQRIRISEDYNELIYSK